MATRTPAKSANRSCSSRRDFLAAAVAAPVVTALAAASAAGESSRWACDIVYDPTGGRESIPCDNRAQAVELADWFGREGDLRAEVVESSPPKPVPLPTVDVYIGAVRNSSGCHVCVASHNRSEVETFVETYNRLNAGGRHPGGVQPVAYLYRESVAVRELVEVEERAMAGA